MSDDLAKGGQDSAWKKKKGWTQTGRPGAQGYSHFCYRSQISTRQGLLCHWLVRPKCSETTFILKYTEGEVQNSANDMVNFLEELLQKVKPQLKTGEKQRSVLFMEIGESFCCTTS